MKKLASQLLVLIENLKIDKFHLIGFSIGALVSIEFATNYEKYLNSLTLISTTYKRSNDESKK
jgi:pimeloyl-ACP methyl ester carboxylesterase